MHLSYAFAFKHLIFVFLYQISCHNPCLAYSLDKAFQNYMLTAQKRGMPQKYFIVILEVLHVISVVFFFFFWHVIFSIYWSLLHGISSYFLNWYYESILYVFLACAYKLLCRGNILYKHDYWKLFSADPTPLQLSIFKNSFPYYTLIDFPSSFLLQ